MDVGGSFLELSCVRIALIPAGAKMPDHRFEELTSHLTAFREIPVSALPRRTSVPRNGGNATFATMPSAFREAFNEASGSIPLLRSRSASRDIGRSSSRTSLPGLRNQINDRIEARSLSSMPLSASRFANDSISFSKVSQAVPTSPTHTADLDMTGPEVDSSFRLRYDVVHRDHSSALIMKPFSEWDDFHSSKIWGVFGLVDCTDPAICESPEKRKLAIFDAYDDFSATLNNFRDASVRRLIVFTSQDAAQESGAFVWNDPKSSPPGQHDSSLHFSVGYVPERSRSEETRLEVRAQIIHFAGLLLNALDRDCWKRRESPATELFLSPIDEKYTADRQSKLVKRRPGRLDKLLGDSLLLMGNPSEAIVKYNSAIEKAKANSDRLWLAGAMEGWSAAHVLNHVGAGGAVNDQALSDRLIEHYAEIYKLYQKKRVAEPEAAAALRLAEFLGRWTNRRRDALDAAEHAATVGEGLRVQKRAALWEALARFSDRMGCRRKAALYLYRLGHLSASQSIWSSSVALMVASERQLTRNGIKPWADLNRKVLLAAASYAEEAGDSSVAARLYVEALVLPRTSASRKREDDVELIKLLGKAQVPAHLPAAQGVIHLEEVYALQSAGLSIRDRVEGGKDINSKGQSRDGPFIYNPFEAKKRAKEAAVARRSVTWVCGESAQVSVRLVNSINAEISIEVIAVLFSTPEAKDDGKSAASEISNPKTKDTDGKKDCGEDDELDAAAHAEHVRQSLTRSSQLAKTITETVTVPSCDRQSGILKHITIIPKRTGSLLVQGILVRLFHGALVLLGRDLSEDGTPVNVICNLPRVSLSTHIVDAGNMERISSRTPLTVYSGERRRFRVDVENAGKEPIIWMNGTVHSSQPKLLKVIEHDLSPNMAESLENHGSSKSFMIEVLGEYPVGYLNEDSDDSDDNFLGHYHLAIVSVIVEYEGKHSAGVIRESGLHVKVASRPAVKIERVDLLDKHLIVSTRDEQKEPVAYGVALEVRNAVAAPATVKVCSFSKGLAYQVMDKYHFQGQDYGLALDKCLIESGASARLISVIASETIKTLSQGLREEAQHEVTTENEDPVLRLMWSLPALGRQGHWDVPRWELCRALVGLVVHQQSSCPTPLSNQCAAQRLKRASLNFALEGAELKNSEASPTNTTAVKVGTFWKATVIIENTSETDLPDTASLDIEIYGDNGRILTQDMNLGLVVGAVEMVNVGALPALSGTFQHTVQVRFSSIGTFRLQACLYDGAKIPLGDEAVQTEEENLSADEHQGTMVKASNLRSHTPDTHRARLERKEVTGPGNVGVRAVGRSGQGNKPSMSSPRFVSADGVQAGSSELDTPRGLKRVGITRRNKVGVKSTPSMNVLQPRTADCYPDLEDERRPAAVLACNEILIAVVDGDFHDLTGTGSTHVSNAH